MTLSRSSGPGFGSFDSGSSSGAAIITAIDTGAAMRNTEPHQKCSRSQPPMIGPAAAPAENPEAQIAMANLRWRPSSKRFRMSASVVGMSVAPARPRNARAAMSISAEVAYAAMTLAAANAAEPMTRSLRRPTRSPIVPMVTRSPASVNP
nr:hypothetical protein GCM10025732_29470 [Glycomyces mayteni]